MNKIKLLDNKAPTTFKQLRKYLIENGGNDCFSKSGGYIFKIQKNNTWIKICRNISDLTFQEYLKESLKNNKTEYTNTNPNLTCPICKMSTYGQSTTEDGVCMNCQHIKEDRLLD